METDFSMTRKDSSGYHYPNGLDSLHSWTGAAADALVSFDENNTKRFYESSQHWTENASCSSSATADGSFVYESCIWQNNTAKTKAKKGGSSCSGKPAKPRPKPKCPVKRQNQRTAANVRERSRMKTINEAFRHLKDRIPLACKERKVSKVDTLRLAINYIHHLHHTVTAIDHQVAMTSSADNYCYDSQIISSHHLSMSDMPPPPPLSAVPIQQPLPFIQGKKRRCPELKPDCQPWQYGNPFNRYYSIIVAVLIGAATDANHKIRDSVLWSVFNTVQNALIFVMSVINIRINYHSVFCFDTFIWNTSGGFLAVIRCASNIHGVFAGANNGMGQVSYWWRHHRTTSFYLINYMVLHVGFRISGISGTRIFFIVWSTMLEEIPARNIRYRSWNIKVKHTIWLE